MLMPETKRCIHVAKDITPFVWSIECGVNNTKIANLSYQLQRTQPHLIFIGELFPRPGYRLFGYRTELREVVGRASVFVVVSFHAGAIQTAHDFHTLMGTRMVCHEISETDIMRRPLSASASARTACSASKFPWMSPKMANRIEGCLHGQHKLLRVRICKSAKRFCCP